MARLGSGSYEVAYEIQVLKMRLFFWVHATSESWRDECRQRRYKLLKHGCMTLMSVSCFVGSNDVILSTAEYGVRLGGESATTRGGECEAGD